MPSLFPRRFQPTERLAALESTADVSAGGLGPLAGKVALTEQQRRAEMYARRIGFVGRSYEFVAWQAARCTLRPERVLTPSDVETPAPDEAPGAWGALDTLQGRRTTQRDLVRSAVFCDDTVGEFAIVVESGGVGRPPTWSVRSMSALTPKKGSVTGTRFGGDREPGYLIADVRGGTVAKGGARWVPARHVFRHWNPADDYELEATSSLLGMLDELDTYWTISRTIRRTGLSQLATSGFLWTASEAHTERMPGRPEVSRLEHNYAQAANARLNDTDDLNVASVAPQMVHTPGAHGPMQYVGVPGLTDEQLAHLQDARMAVADALPLSTSSVLNEAQGNHWNEWLAAEGDVELIEDRLTRVCASFTEAMYRPTLEALRAAGLWDGNVEEWRIGFDVDPIRRRPDNSANAFQAFDRHAIGFEALRRETHFSKDDAPTYEEHRQMLTITAFRAGKPAPDFDGGSSSGSMAAQPGPQQITTPVADTQAPPDDPVPDPPAEMTAALPVIDDRWLLEAPGPS